MKSVCDSLKHLFVLGYIHLYFMIMKMFGLRMRGLGFALRILRHEYVFHVQGLKFWFNPRCAAAYCIMPGGYWNEPETHVFLDNILSIVSGEIAFIDVGASVGEMVIHMAAHQKVRHVTAFEPQAECAVAIEKSAKLNSLSNILVVPCAASKKTGFISFSSSYRNPTAAAISSHSHGYESIVSLDVPCVTVDETIKAIQGLKVIMLIDVEGHEPSVLLGAANMVKSVLPLIIFEYNDTSKKHFSLSDIRNILPDSYSYYRLRGDGRLDQDFRNSWNCVAVPAGTEFAKICKGSIV